MVKRAFFLSVLMALAQPAAATQMVDLSIPDRAAASCPADDAACTTSGRAGAQGASDMESGDSGPIIAGLLGMLVLGAVFGRRKSGLPEVVS